MKHVLGLVLFIALIIFFASPAGAYLHVNSGTDNCQSCHLDKFADGTVWHDNHQANASFNCLACHTNTGNFGAAMETSVCNACHPSQPCQWVNNHPDPPKSDCLQCHVECNAQPTSADLSLADVALPCGTYGTPADMPLTLTNDGASIAGVSADITFNTTYFDFVGATIGPAGSAAGKDVVVNQLSPGLVRIGVFSDSNINVIADGMVAIVHFTLKRNPVGGIDIGIVPGASDPIGNPVTDHQRRYRRILHGQDR